MKCWEERKEGENSERNKNKNNKSNKIKNKKIQLNPALTDFD